MEALGRWLNRLLDDFATVLFNLLFVIVFWQVLCRYVLAIPSPWTEEIARYLLITITFLGAGIATRERSHLVAIDLFSGLPRGVAFANRVAIQCSILLLAAILFSGGLTMVELGHGETATSLHWLPMSYVYAVLPVGFALIFIYTARNLVRLFCDRPRATGIKGEQ